VSRSSAMLTRRHVRRILRPTDCDRTYNRRMLSHRRQLGITALRTVVLAMWALSISGIAIAQEIAAAKGQNPLPPELTDAVRQQLTPGSTEVRIGETTAEFWWVARLPVKSTGQPEWSAVEEGALVGALRLASAMRDIRGRNIKPGVYTLRYGIQPANGDHLGVSPHREFLLVSPAAIDTDSKPAGAEGAIAMSKQSIGGSHPAVLSIDPLTTAAEPLSVQQNAAGHKAIVFEVPTTAGAALRFGLILVGKIEA
jgi:hypothetical protein